MTFRDNSTQVYDQLLALRDEQDAQRRGYRFEQLIREILPWDYRPPIAVSASHEQLDAFFDWNGWHFLVEAKAKKNRITAGSHDWEDFNLKVEKRRGQCIGLFCSLYDVSPKLYEIATTLNRNGKSTIIIAGDTWDDLKQDNVLLTDYLRFMLNRSKSTFESSPPEMIDVTRWCYESVATTESVAEFCRSISSTFLRRFKSQVHEKIYVSRLVDENITQHTKNVRPNALSKKRKYSHKKRVEHLRAAPKQVVIVRDLSGTGKTTLSVQIALEKENYFGMSRAGLQTDIDDISDRLSVLGDDLGINALVTLNKPLVYAVDSLDESSVNPHKKREVLSLLRSLGKLNDVARERGLRAFPLCLVFTVRDDFWGDWEGTFEGTPKVTIARRFSRFTPNDFVLALKKYSAAFHYRLVGKLEPEIRNVLSHPFSLQVFSEANLFRGDIDATSLLDQNVLARYFDSKREDILKRPIPGFTGDVFMAVCTQIAREMCNMDRNLISTEVAKRVVSEVCPPLAAHAESILKILVSEQILVTDPDDNRIHRMRHVRFLEYLVASYIANELIRTNDPDVLGKLTRKLVKQVVSVLNVHEFIRHVCLSTSPEIYHHLTEYFAKSKQYVSALLNQQRRELACGGRTSVLEIDTVRAAVLHNDPKISWNTFFVVAARHNRRPNNDIVEAFDAAWRMNPQSHDGWKLLAKMSERGLLLDECVLLSVVQSNSDRDWYVLLDGVYEQGLVPEFREAWKEVGGTKLREILLNRGGDWHRVVQILDIVLSGKEYDPSTIA